MQPDDMDAMAAEVVLLVKSALAPLQERIAVQDAHIAALQNSPYIGATKELWAGLEQSVVSMRERLAVLEARPLVPGPPGEPGAPGKDGEPGKPGLTYQGVYQDGKAYDVGDMVTWAGSTWNCNEPTTTKPGEYIGAKAWTLMVKRGRDGKDAK